MKVIVNNNIYDKDEKTFPFFEESIFYGYGVFETIKIRNCRICFFREHFERMEKSLEKLQMHKDFIYEDLKKAADNIVLLNNIQNGSLKITILKNKSSCDVILSATDKKYTEEEYSNGFKLKVSENRKNERSILAGIKSCCYTENIIELNQAKKEGYNEVLFLNTKDFVCEGALSNIFFIKDSIVNTPSANTGLLEGIMRKKVLEILQNKKIHSREGMYSLEELMDADEVFITNSLMDIMPVCSINDKDFDIAHSSITRIITEEVKKLYN